jgi:hypothetical protein
VVALLFCFGVYMGGLALRFREGLFALAIFALAIGGGPAAADDPTVQVTSDQFESKITLLGSAEAVNPFGGTFRLWRIRSWVDKTTHAVSHQLYVEISYSGGWQYYSFASDDTAKDLNVSKISSNVGSCSGGSCSLSEVVGVELDDATLRARQSGGYPIKLKAQSGDWIILTISPAQIALKMAAVDKYVKDPAAAALAVPAGQSPRDAEFGASFSAPFGFDERWTGRALKVADFHEGLAGSIIKGSIAEKAGLRWNDGIYEFDGQQIKSIPDLLEKIRAVPPGKAVDFKVERGRKSITLHAQF